MPVGTRAHCNPRRSLIVDVEMLITSNEGHLTDETPAYLERQRTPSMGIWMFLVN